MSYLNVGKLSWNITIYFAKYCLLTVFDRKGTMKQKQCFLSGGSGP